MAGTTRSPNPYRGFRFPAEVIEQAVWLYHCFSGSLRDVETILALLTVAHVADVAVLMHGCDGQYAELRNALAELPRGTELTTVLERSEPASDAVCTSLPIYEHIAQLVTIDRSGYAADFFARVTSVAVRGGRLTDTDPASAETFTTAPAAGYVLWLHLGHPRSAPPGLILLRHGSFFDLWTVA